MNDFSEQQIKKDCPHCDPHSFALKHPLKTTENFWVVCDVHPLTKGHVLIIPKQHLSCVGEFPENIYKEFIGLYNLFSDFIRTSYGSVSSFEHGKIGQTVFHSHIQMFPFNGQIDEVIPEGSNFYKSIDSMDSLKNEYKVKDSYLYCSIGNKNWVVDIALGKPAFFRNRFGKALGCPERGNWKEMHANEELMKNAEVDIKDTEEQWKAFNTSKEISS